MRTSLAVRAGVVVLLGAVGIGLAVIGTSIGLGAGITTADNDRITIGEESVTVADSNGETVAIEDLETVSSVEVTSYEDRVAIETEEPFSEAERQEAIDIVRTNETVTAAIDVEAYEFTAEPIETLTLEETEIQNVTIENGEAVENAEIEGGDNVTFSVTKADDGETETVTADRDPEYVEDTLNVKIIDPKTDQRRFSARVDLQNESISSLNDWDEVERGNVEFD